MFKKIWEEIGKNKPLSGYPSDYSLIENLFFGIVLLIITPLIFRYIIIPILFP